MNGNSAVENVCDTLSALYPTLYMTIVNSQFIVVSHFMPMMIFFMILLLECKTLQNKGFDLDFTIK